VKEWETARMTRMFPPEIKARLRDNKREFHLEPDGPDRWSLFEISYARFTHDASQATPTHLQFTNANPAQPLQWMVRSTSKQPLAGVALALNDRSIVDLKDRTLPPGGCLKYRGGATASICDPNWKEVGRVEVAASESHLGPGVHPLTLGCALQPGALLKLELGTRGTATPIGKPLASDRPKDDSRGSARR
jgi:hypothetical protein